MLTEREMGAGITLKEAEYGDFIDYLCNKFSEKEVDDMFIEFKEKYGY